MIAHRGSPVGGGGLGQKLVEHKELGDLETDAP
jgi:hypothetical protein